VLKFISRVVRNHPWRVVIIWIIGSAIVIGLAPKLGDYTTANQQSFLSKSYESVQAQDVANQKFPAQSGASGSLVVNRSDGAVLSQADQSKVASLATTLQNAKIPGVVSAKVTANSLSKNGKVEIVLVQFAGQAGDATVNAAVPLVRSDSTTYLHGSGLTSGLTGSASTSVDTNAAYDHAEKIIGIATVILILLLLGLIFRSPIAAFLPIIIILLIHSVTQGLTASLAKGFGFQVGNSLGPLLIVVLFGVGTDYIIFMLFRYRENLHAGDSFPDALGKSTDVIGKVIASSALTVMAAFASLLLSSLGSLKTLAPGLIVAVAVMLVAALTLVPALLVLLGSHLFWPWGAGHPSEKPVSGRIGRSVSSHPIRVAGGIVGVLVLLALGIMNYTSTYNTLGELPSGTESLTAYNTLQSAFPPGALAPTQVYVNGTAPIDPNSLTNLTNRLTAANGVSFVAPPQLSSDQPAALVTVVLKDNPFSAAALDDVQGPVRQAANGAVPGKAVLVGGQTSTLVDVRSSLRHDTHLVIPVAAGIIAVILGLLLLAVVAPVYLILGVALTYAATLGATALVFLTLGGLVGIDFANPIVLFLFVIAIGSDYNILMSDRLREEFMKGRSPKESVREAITHGAPAVWAAGVILAGTFASLLISGIANLVELGFGVTVGIVIAAFFLAPLLVPSISQLQGRTFWWPSRSPDRGGNGETPPVPGPDPRHKDLAGQTEGV
jgi:RND superfamily putative drug exporter